MEIRELNTFLKVAALQNFSKAAQQLGYSQSAVTLQMQHLEKELNVRLFERIGKRVYLTGKGREFIPYAGGVLQAHKTALGFACKDDEPGGTLRIGGVESVCTALIPRLLPDFYRRCPKVEVIIRSGPTDDLINLAESNQLDMVLTLDKKIFRPELVCSAEQEEEIIFVTAAGSDVSSPKVPLQALCRRPFLLTETGAAYRYELEQLLADRQTEIRPILEIGNTETIINLLKAGIGASFLPRFTVEEELRAGTLTELHTDLPRVTMHRQLLRYRSKWVTPQMQVFSDLVNQSFSK